jgi:hypothetical protein
MRANSILPDDVNQVHFGAVVSLNRVRSARPYGPNRRSMMRRLQAASSSSRVGIDASRPGAVHRLDDSVDECDV